LARKTADGGELHNIMTDNNPTEAHPPAGSDEAQQDVAQASDTKAEAAATATAGDELSEKALEAVAGGGSPRPPPAILNPSERGGQRHKGQGPINLKGEPMPENTQTEAPNQK
jgi:hypothetical protein